MYFTLTGSVCILLKVNFHTFLYILKLLGVFITGISWNQFCVLCWQWILVFVILISVSVWLVAVNLKHWGSNAYYRTTLSDAIVQYHMCVVCVCVCGVTVDIILQWNKICTPSDTTIFLVNYFKCWPLVSAWIGHHQTYIYKNFKMLMHIIHNLMFLWPCIIA